MKSRLELQAEARIKLERLIREKYEVESSKSEANRGFNDALKAIESSIAGVIREIDECQPTLPFGEGEVKP